MKKKVSLKDIAEKVGVSTALVSYVLNNKKVGRISQEVAKRIKDTASELNYRTNFIAKSLKTNRTYTIGLIVSDISNSFFSSLARIIEDEAEKYHYTVLFGSSDECAERSSKLINILLNHQVDGIIFAPAENSEKEIEYLQKTEFPFVLIDRYFTDRNIPFVAIDNYTASYEAVQHLINSNCQRIGLVSYNSSLHHLRDRNRGYMDALKNEGMEVNQEFIKYLNSSYTSEDVQKAIDELINLPQPVDAILFASNTLSTNGLKYINALNIKVPDDLAIVSFDQSDAADLFYAPLTHLKQPLQEMGALAVKMLLNIIEKKEIAGGIKMKAELVIRKSTLKTKLAPVT